MAVRLTRDLVDFVESGVSIIIGSRDARLRPECARGLGAAVSADGTVVTALLHAPLAARMRANLEDNGLVAVTFSRILDHRTIQLKGRVVALREGSPDDDAIAARYLVAFAEQVSFAGLPRSVVRRVRTTPTLAIDFQPTDLFLQTPGPNAGRRMEDAR
jgi:hypothetical protein